jgi:predicted metalloprotease
MRYDDRDQVSKNVEDVRGRTGGGGGGFPGGVQIPIGKGGMSLTTLLIVGAIMLLFGFNPLELLGGGGPGGMPNLPQQPRMENPRQAGAPNLPGLPNQGGVRTSVDRAEDAQAVFVGRVLKDTEDVWGPVFQSIGRRYEAPGLQIFKGRTQTACGAGMAQMGPFYCPADQKVYIDLAFYEELQRRFGAPGDFAQAYVVAHEVGHHVQTLLGIAAQVQQRKARLGMSSPQANQIQVRMELQADCLAGVWAAQIHRMKNRLEPGDIEEGLNAAAAIGDDMIQKRMQGHVVPESFTHGSSAQRVRWFRRGMETGQIQACDTFNTNDL